jgi:hypothetical protein
VSPAISETGYALEVAAFNLKVAEESLARAQSELQVIIDAATNGHADPAERASAEAAVRNAIDGLQASQAAYTEATAADSSARADGVATEVVLSQASEERNVRNALAAATASLGDLDATLRQAGATLRGNLQRLRTHGGSDRVSSNVNSGTYSIDGRTVRSLSAPACVELLRVLAPVLARAEPFIALSDQLATMARNSNGLPPIREEHALKETQP